MPDYVNPPSPASYAPPLIDLGPKISGLADSYWAGLDEAYKRRNQNAFANGLPIDPKTGQVDLNAAAETIARTGGADKAMPVLDLLQGIEANKTVSGALSGRPGQPSPYFPNAPGGGPAPNFANLPVDQPPAPTGPPGGSSGVDAPGTSSLLAAVAPHVTDVETGKRMAAGVARIMGIKPEDIDKPLDQDKFAIAKDFARQAAGPRRGAPGFAAPPPDAAPLPATPVQTTRYPQPQGQPQQQPDDPVALKLVPQRWLDQGGTIATWRDFNASAASLRGVSENAKAIALARIKAIDEYFAKTAEPTPGEKDYRANRNQNETRPAYDARAAGLKQTAEVEAKTQADEYVNTQKLGEVARKEAPKLQLALKHLSDANFDSGIGSKYMLGLKQIAVRLGGDPNTAAPMEEFRKVVNDNIANGLQTFKGLGGQIRNAQIRLIENATASTDITPESNRALTEMALRLHQRNDRLADMARVYKGAHGSLDAGWDAKVAEFDQKNPIIKPNELKDPRLISPPVFNDPAAVMRSNLPRGAPFKTPDGEIRYKP